MSSLAGTFLVARPSFSRGFFARNVILLLRHDEDGAFGLVLNRPAAIDKLPCPVFIGGPCKMGGVAMIHGQSDTENQSGLNQPKSPKPWWGSARSFGKRREFSTKCATQGRIKLAPPSSFDSCSEANAPRLTR